MRNSRWRRHNDLPAQRRRRAGRFFLEPLEERRLLATNITQYHVDYQSTGANLTETQLTPSNVNATDFGQLYNTGLDGEVYTEPLVLTNVTISQGPNTVGTAGNYASVVFVATEHDSVYALNAANGAILWQRTFLDTANTNDRLPGATSVTSVPSGDTLTGDISPEVGITGTPVIDPSTNILYVIAATKETVNGNAYYVQRLHALNVGDGSDSAPAYVIGSTTNGNDNTTPISVPGTGDGNVGGVVQFNALRENNRPALSLVNGRVYAEWASHGDNGPYHGWVVVWDVTSLSTKGMLLSGVLCTDPNGAEGGIWGGGGGLTFDPDLSANGQPIFYFEVGNGAPRGGNPPLDANGFPSDNDYYESLVKVETDPSSTSSNPNSNGWGLKIDDYFTPFNVNALDDADEDFGSGSPLVLPDSAGIPDHPHLLVAAGKEGKIYLVDRDNLGKFHANSDNVLNSVFNSSTGITTPPTLINGSLSTPAFYHGTLYWVSGYNGNAWSYVVAPNPAPNPPTVPVAAVEPTSETATNNFGYVPGSVMITANGSEDSAGGIVWIMDTGNNEIHAFSSLSLSTELWNSGGGSISTVKFAVPTIANGQVFVGTQNGLQSFGITGASTPAQPPNTPANVAAEALSGSAVELTWTDSTVSPNFATSYAVQEQATGMPGLFKTVANAPAESTSYTLEGLSPNTTYIFRIVGTNAAGLSTPSGTVTVTTTNQTGQTPTAPRGLGATPASGSEAYLTWTNTATNQTGFLLTRATDNLFTQNVVTQMLASAPYYYTDGTAGISPGHTYYYKLQATNASGLSSTSNTASVTIPKLPPAPTKALAVLQSGQVLLSWTDHAGPFALGYQISRSVDGGSYTIYAILPETSDSPPSTQTYLDTSVPLGHSYTYEIVAQNVSGFSTPAYASVNVLGTATVSLDNAGNLVFTAGPGVPDRLTVQLSAGVYHVADSAAAISVIGADAGLVAGAGTTALAISSSHVSVMTLDTADGTDSIRIISDAVPITIAADSGGGTPMIDLGHPTNNELISGPITNASNGTISIAGSGTTTISGALICQGSGGIALTGTGSIHIAGAINLGPLGNLVDSGSGQVSISGLISGTATSGLHPAQGLIGTYFNLPYQSATSPLIDPPVASNAAWLGNQAPALTAQLIGPIDFPDIANNGFADNVGNPAYYNLGTSNNNNVEARWYGQILIPGTGTTAVPINFATTSDDGSMLYIDGNAVVFNDYNQGATQRPGLANLTPGLHSIDVEYYQGQGGASMVAQWDTAGGTNFVDIPNSAFSSMQPANAVTMTGTGTLTLSGANTYVGATTIDAGTLTATANGALGPATATGIFVNPGGALVLSGGVTYTTAEPITLNGSGPAGHGALENSSGTNTLAIPITLSGAATIGSQAGTLKLTGAIATGPNTLTVVGAGTTTITGNITSRGGNLVLSDSGVVHVAGNIDLGARGNITDSGSGQDTIAETITGSATPGPVQGLVGTYFNLPAGGSLIQPAAASNVGWLGNQTPVVTAQLVGPIDFPDIANNGFADSVGDPAYFNLGGGNNNVEARWYGEIMIPGTGTTPVPINFATTSDDGSMLYIDGIAVVSNNNFQPATQATGLAQLTPGLHTIDVEFYQGGGGASMVAQWDPTGGTNFVDIPNSAFSSPQLFNSLTKTGSGTLTLSNVDTLVGPTTVNGGVLLVNGKAVHSAITVNTGGTVGGSGTLGTVTVASGGTFAPGGSGGTITTDNLSLASGSTFLEQLAGPTAGTQYSQTIVPAGGSVALGGATLSLSFGNGFTPSQGESFTLFKNQSSTSVAGTFSQGSTNTVINGYAFAINYAGGAGQDVVLTEQGAGPQVQSGVLTVPGTPGPAAITLIPTLLKGSSTYSLVVRYTINGSTLSFGPFAAATVTVNGGPGADSVTLDGTTGIDAFTVGNGVVTELAAKTTLFTVNLNGVSSTTLDGRGGGDTLTGPNQANAWVITGFNAGTLDSTIAFRNVSNLTGGSVGDTFTFDQGGAIYGNLIANAPTNTLAYSQYGVPARVDLQTTTATGIGGTWTNIQNFLSTGTADTLVAADTANTWSITGTNAGTVGAVSFSGFANLTGGSGNDSFAFHSGGSITGNLSGGLGYNTLDDSQYGSAVTVNLATKTATAIGGTFTIIHAFVGTGTTDSLIGSNAFSVWSITGTNTGNVSPYKFSAFPNLTGGSGGNTFEFVSPGALSGTLTGGGGTETILGDNNGDTFSITGGNAGSIASILPGGFTNIGTLIGGAGNDRFTFLAGGSIAGNLSGGLGYNTLDDSQYGSTITVNLATKADTGIAGTFAMIDAFAGTGTTDTLVGSNAGNVWWITGSNAGTVGPYAFSAFPNLTGGTGGNIFEFKQGAATTGVTKGGSGGTNELDYSAFGSPVTVNLQTSTTTGVGAWSNIQTIRGTNTTDTLIGMDGTTNTWTLSGGNAGTVDGVAFLGFANLTGGSGADDFVFGAGARVSGVVNGMGGSNTLDYTAYTTPVRVNLGSGTAGMATSSATGIHASDANGIANIGAVIVGSGNNVLSAAGASTAVTFTVEGNGNNIVVGGSGTNTLTVSGSGNNVVIGDQGASTLNGGTGYNLLIGGATAYDAVLADLESILGIWETVNGVGTYSAAISKLMAKSYAYALSSATVHGDASDTIVAGTHNLDWYFTALASEITGETPGETDTPC
jgi:autotransporter-associated beta strand protein